MVAQSRQIAPAVKCGAPTATKVNCGVALTTWQVAMTLFVLTYDQRATHHDYSKLYQLLKSWNASPLLNSVWLVEINGEACEAE
jgi:hypothetical protein